MRGASLAGSAPDAPVPYLNATSPELQALVAGIVPWLRGAVLEGKTPVAGGAVVIAPAPVPWLRKAAIEAKAPVASIAP